MTLFGGTLSLSCVPLIISDSEIQLPLHEQARDRSQFFPGLYPDHGNLQWFCIGLTLTSEALPGSGLLLCSGTCLGPVSW